MKAYLKRRPKKTIPRSKGHHRDWLNACKGGTPASANFDYTGPLTEFVLLGNVAQHIPDKKLTYDGKNMKVTNDTNANRYLNSPFREGWSL